MREFSASVGIADRIVECEVTSQYSRGSPTGWPRRSSRVQAGGSFFGLLEDGAWFGDVAEREVLLDGARVDLALQAAMGEERLEF